MYVALPIQGIDIPLDGHSLEIQQPRMLSRTVIVSFPAFACSKVNISSKPVFTVSCHRVPALSVTYFNMRSCTILGWDGEVKHPVCRYVLPKSIKLNHLPTQNIQPNHPRSTNNIPCRISFSVSLSRSPNRFPNLHPLHCSVALETLTVANEPSVSSVPGSCSQCP